MPRPIRQAELRETAAALISEHALTGERPVAVLAGNGLAFLVARQLTLELGVPLVPINPALRAQEIHHIVRDSGAGTLLVHPDLVEHLDEEELEGRDGLTLIPTSGALAEGPRTLLVHGEGELSPEGIGATIIYTSGTTGKPKGCLRSAEQECARAAELIESFCIGSGDVQLIASPLAHSAPGIFVRAAAAAGATSLVLPRFDEKAVWQALHQEQVSFFFMVPTQFHRLLRAHGEQPLPESLRAAIVAGAPLSHHLRRQLHAWIGTERFWEFYGSSETGTVSILPPEIAAQAPGSVGRPTTGVEIEIRKEDGSPCATGEVGEIFVRSPTVMSGYLNNEAPRDFSTHVSVGDLGYLDERGFLYLVDRKHDTIISGGVNVYPAEVEAALVADIRVDAAVAFGLEDEEWGQRVVAFVSSSDHDLDGDELEALRQRCKEHLAGYKVPKELRHMPRKQMPIGASGKPLRRRAREMWLES